MTVTQTVDIPESHRLVIDVPREVLAGRSVIFFKPATEADFEECPICAAHRDPETGEELFNEKTKAAIREGMAISRGEIPSKLYNSFEEMWTDLETITFHHTGAHSDLF
jgi:hypothetical protein